jgi:hypothetical protein
MPKTSDLAGNKKRPNWVSPAHLARFQDCDERTVREWCKKGDIPEAYKTPGGHWRISMPLSGKTRDLLHRRSSDWPFEKGKGDMQGADWSLDVAERLMLFEWYQVCLDEGISMPPIAELEDPYCGDEIEPSTDPLELKARKIHDQIMQRVQKKKSVSDLILTAWVCEFWRKMQRRPTVAEIAEWMGLSKTAWYRRYARKDLYKAILVAHGRVAPHLPDPKGLDSVQRANIRAKKKLRFRSA